MSERTPRDACTRRTLLKTGVGATALAATGATGTALAQEEPYDGYLSDANGFGGTTAEYTDTDGVTVEVGAGEQGVGFNLPAIKVPSGTTVTWEWTGNGGAHNVVAEDETFNSGETVESEDETFEYTFEEGGVYQYYCSPHRALGMKGVVVVGDNAQGDVAPASEVEYGSSGSDDGGSEDGEDGEDGGSSDFDFGGYLEGANLYDGSVEDLTGESAVTVDVGAGNGFAFDPAAIQIDPGTTVTWEWTGEGGAHNVIANDGTFESGQTQTSGTFEYTFEEEATHTYYCDPHEGAGMKGAVVVGEGGDGGGGGGGEETAANETALQMLLAMVVLGLLSPIVFLLFVRRRMGGPPAE